MSPNDAAKILDLPPDATPEQLEARFHELRTRLEEKIGKAPTPGLKAKYRESLDEITQAFETLTLAADSSSLPVTRKQGATPGGPVSAPAASAPVGSPLAATSRDRSAQAPTLHPRPKSGSREFAIVALIAVVLLGAGGWWVMKTRAEKADQDRRAAEAQVEKDRLAAAAKAEQERLAIERKQADEAERIRLEKLTGQLRASLAEARVAWEAIEREERSAERRLSELKSDLRSLRDATAGRLAEARATVAAHQEYYDWLSDTLARHPAKIARGQTEELLSARQIDEAAAALAGLKTALSSLEQEIPRKRGQLLDLDGDLDLRTAADASWTIEDAFSQTRSGTGPARVDGLAIGPAKLTVRKNRWPTREEKLSIQRDRPTQVEVGFAAHTLELTSMPAGAEVLLADGSRLGTTPLRLEGYPPGTLKLTLRKDGHYDHPLTLEIPGAAPAVTLRVKPKGMVKPERWNGPAKVRVEMAISSQSTGTYGSNTSSQFVEEWNFSEPDPKLGWRQATRRWVSLSGSNREYMPVDGSVALLSRQPDGSWSGSFIQGGLKNPDHNRFWTAAPTGFWLVTFGLQDFFPSEPVEVGGTWAVKPEVFFGTIGLKNATGKVQGRLVNLERSGSTDWAELEFSYSYTIANLTSQALTKLRVNLTDGYVVRMEGKENAASGDMKINTSHSTTITAR